METNETTRLIDAFQRAVDYQVGPVAPMADDLQLDDETLKTCLAAVARPEVTLEYGDDWVRRARTFLRALLRLPEIEREYVA